MIIRQLIHVERVPRGLISRLDVTGEDAVPEIELLQLGALGVVTPDNAYVQHVEVIIGKPVHATVVVVMTVRDNHANYVVLVLWRDVILNVLVDDIEGAFSGRYLCRLFCNLGHKIDVPGQIVPVPERYN